MSKFYDLRPVGDCIGQYLSMRDNPPVARRLGVKSTGYGVKAISRGR